jgi:hypothetical protein
LIKYSKLVFVFCITMTLSSCSWITKFVIANTSQSQLYVSYLVSGKSCPDDNVIIVPARKQIADLKKNSVTWQKLTSNDYTCDASNFVVTTSLPPNTALLVASVATYTGSASYGNDNFQVLRLELKGTEGEISLKGLQVLKKFIFENDSLYVLYY